MLDRAKHWHSGLSKGGKIFLWATTAIIGGSAISGATSTNSTPQPAVPAAQVETAEAQKPTTTRETISETKKIAFSKTTVNDSNLAEGKTEVRTTGVDGAQIITYEVTYEDGVEVNRRELSKEVTTKPVAQVTAIGTKKLVTNNCDPNYSPCVPRVSYDLDCPDIGFTVTVIGSDLHGFDGDNDGHGCESY